MCMLYDNSNIQMHSCNILGDTYAEHMGATSCSKCPKRTRLAPGVLMENITDCICQVNSWRPDGRRGEPCIDCPPGGSCSGGLQPFDKNLMAAPFPRPGFWAQSRLDTGGKGLAQDFTDDLMRTASADKTHEAVKDFRAAWSAMASGSQTRTLQAQYITENPHPLGKKDELDRATADEEYNSMHGKHHNFYRMLLRKKDYYDIFLFDPAGNLIYSVIKELDYATNLVSGPYKDSGLGKAFRAAFAKPNAVHVIDFEPSHGALASFISTGIIDKGGKLHGILSFKVRQTAHKTLEGFPFTGELVVKDGVDTWAMGDGKALPTIFFDAMGSSGGAQFDCKESRKGAKCTQCSKGSTQISTNCVKCRNNAVDWVIAVGGISCVVSLWVVINSLSAGKYDALDIGTAHRMHFRLACARTHACMHACMHFSALLFAQLLNIVQGFSTPWPQEVAPRVLLDCLQLYACTLSTFRVIRY